MTLLDLITGQLSTVRFLCYLRNSTNCLCNQFALVQKETNETSMCSGQRKARTAKIKILGVGSQDDETFLLCKVPFGFALGLAPQLPWRYYILRTIQRHGLVNSDAWSLALRMVRHPQNSPDSLLFLAKDQNSSQWFKSHALSSPFSCTKGLAVISGAYWLD